MAAAGVQVSSIARIEESNTLLVRVVDDRQSDELADAQQPNEVAERLLAPYSDHVTIVDVPTPSEETCRGSRQARDLCPSPLRGGVTLANSSTGGRCTQSFNAINNLGNEYVLSAGHCGASSQVFTHNFRDVGYVAQSINSGRTDAMRILKNNGNFAHSRWIVDETSSDAFQIRDVARVGEYRAGDIVCISGINTLKSCGQIISTNASGTTNTQQIDGAWCNVGGDSGAPIYDDNRFGDQTNDGRIEGTAVGIQQGRYAPCGGLASHIQNVETDLGVRVRTN